MDGTAPYSASTTALLTRSLDREHGFEPLRVEGTIPASLEGTLYRVGPGLFDSVGVRVTHLFEADGAVTAIRIGNGRAEGAIRVVDTAALREERAAGVPLYGPRASYPRRLLRALARKSKNAANTAPMFHRDRLFALYEAGKPTEIDPETLATIGETDLDGTVRFAFSAHPHRVEARRAQYNFGVSYGRRSFLEAFELPDAGPARKLVGIPLSRPVMLHDFIATATKLVFFVSPFEVVVPRAALQLGRFEDMFSWRPEHGTEVIVIPIDSPSRVTRFEVPAFYQWHFGNAFDDGDAVLVDFVRYSDPDSFYQFGNDEPLGGAIARVRMDPIRSTCDVVARTEGAFEFPSVDPRVTGGRHRYVFTTAESPTTRGIARHDCESGARDVFADGTHTWYAEPVFAPTPGGREGEGYLLTLALDARAGRTDLVIFDADRVAEGPIARASFDRPLPMTFHGLFRPRAG